MIVKISGKAVAVACLFALLVLVGCTRHNDRESADSSLAALFFASRSGDTEAQHQAVVEAIAQCMRAQGFDYVPDGADDAPDARYQSYWLHPDAEQASAIGFGIVDSEMAIAESRIAALGAVLQEDEARSFGGIENSAAYQQALWGEDGKGGCVAVARDAERSEQAIVVPPDVWVRFAEELADSQELFLIEEDWSRCMGSFGFSFAGEADAQNYVALEVDRVLDSLNSALASAERRVGPSALAGTGAEMQAELEVPISELDRIRALEVEIATSASDCMEDQSDRLSKELARIEGVVQGA